MRVPFVPTLVLTLASTALGAANAERLARKTDTIFEIMSMTKPVTATAIMMLAEEGKLALGDGVETHLREFRGQDERIFKPLGMKDSFLFAPESHHPRIANVYQANAGKLMNLGPGIFRKGARYSFSEGGLYSTAADMAAFYQCFLNGAKPLLSKASHETMLAIHSGDTLSGGTGWGLGWSVTQNNGGRLDLRSMGAYGHAGAFGTFGWVDPARQLVGVFMIQGGAAEESRHAFVEMANAAIE